MSPDVTHASEDLSTRYVILSMASYIEYIVCCVVTFSLLKIYQSSSSSMSFCFILIEPQIFKPYAIKMPHSDSDLRSPPSNLSHGYYITYNIGNNRRWW